MSCWMASSRDRPIACSLLQGFRLPGIAGLRRASMIRAARSENRRFEASVEGRGALGQLELEDRWLERCVRVEEDDRRQPRQLAVDRLGEPGHDALQAIDD